MRLRLIAVISAVGFSACIGPLSEMFEREYESLQSAKAAGAVGEGRWIPAILPDGATSIREVHDIDTNQTWGCFKTKSPAAVRSLLASLDARETKGSIAQRPKELFRDFTWWPESMASGAIEAWEFVETATYPGGLPYVVRVGIDVAGGVVCFHRAL